MTGKPTVIMPFVKLEKKFIREGWKIVKASRTLDRGAFTFWARAMFCSSLGGVLLAVWLRLERAIASWMGVAGKSGFWERVESSMVSVVVLILRLGFCAEEADEEG